jgi:hypothetical protein
MGLKPDEMQALFVMQQRLGALKQSILSMVTLLENMEEEITTIGIRLIGPEGGQYGEATSADGRSVGVDGDD